MVNGWVFLPILPSFSKNTDVNGCFWNLLDLSTDLLFYLFFLKKYHIIKINQSLWRGGIATWLSRFMPDCRLVIVSSYLEINYKIDFFSLLFSIAPKLIFLIETTVLVFTKIILVYFKSLIPLHNLIIVVVLFRLIFKYLLWLKYVQSNLYLTKLSM